MSKKISIKRVQRDQAKQQRASKQDERTMPKRGYKRNGRANSRYEAV